MIKVKFTVEHEAEYDKGAGILFSGPEPGSFHLFIVWAWVSFKRFRFIEFVMWKRRWLPSITMGALR